MKRKYLILILLPLLLLSFLSVGQLDASWYPQPKTQINALDSLTGLTNTEGGASVDSTNFIEGTAGIKLSVPTTTCTIEQAHVADMTGVYAFQLRIYVANLTGFTNFKVFFSTGDATYANYYVVTVTTLINNVGWNNITVFRDVNQIGTPPATDFSVGAGSPNWNAVKAYKLRITGSAGFNATLDDFEKLTYYSEFPNGAVIYRIDDGKSDVYTTALGILNASYPAVIGVITDNVGTSGYMTHTHTHQTTLNKKNR